MPNLAIAESIGGVLAAKPHFEGFFYGAVVGWANLELVEKIESFSGHSQRHYDTVWC